MIPIFILCGPCGVGKTTQGKILSSKFNFSFIEGDSLHTNSNILKMSKGISLTDSDRFNWLNSIRDYSISIAEQNETNGVIVTCSALKRSYRNLIRKFNGHSNVKFYFLFLTSSREIIFDRVSKRKGHYMKSNMVDSQFEIQELPTSDEKDSFLINVSGSIEYVSNILIEKCNEIIHKSSQTNREL